MILEYKPTAVKQLKKIPKVEIKKNLKKLTSLAQDPYAGKPLKGEFNGLYSLRAWPYRIIYEVNPEKKIIVVLTVTHRHNTYK